MLYTRRWDGCVLVYNRSWDERMVVYDRIRAVSDAANKLLNHCGRVRNAVELDYGQVCNKHVRLAHR